MSTELTTAVTITPSATDVSVNNNYDLVTANSYEIGIDPSATVVEGHKKEYSIVGDTLYASISAQEAPTWLTTIIADVVNTAVASGMVNYDLLVQDVQNAIDSIDVASNTYVEKTNFTGDVNALIATQLATLNTTYGDTFATKVELTALEASTTSALATQAVQIESGYTDAINAKATEIITAYTAADAVNASNISALTTVFSDQNALLDAQSTALSGLQTYIGVDGSNTPNGTGLTKSFTDLSLALTTLDDSIYGTSGLEQSIYAAIDTEGARVESKFEYNSVVGLNGVYYKAGFGLDTSITTTGTGTELDPYDSIFWINAQKFKFTNTNKTGSVAPFTIDASGATPTVTFNGVVSFTNVSGTPTHTSGAANPTGTAINGSTYRNTSTNIVWIYNGAWRESGDPLALVPFDLSSSGTTVIDGGRISTNTLHASKITAGTIEVDRLAATSLSAMGMTIGTLSSAGTGARMVFTDTKILVYDSNNVLRVKIGDLT